MNIETWKSRNLNPKLDENFNHQEGTKFSSNWNYTKTLSSYHFDPCVNDDSGWYAKLGKFQGDWEIDLSFLKNNCKLKPLSDRPWQREEGNILSEQEKNDLIIYGIEDSKDYCPYWHLSSTDAKKNCPTFIKMCEYFKLDKLTMGFHVQKPGQFLHIHIDKLQQRNPIDTNRIVRMHVYLEDYDPGQFIGYGNDIFSHWKAGQVVIEDWANIPHCYINAGKLPVCWITLTGLRTVDTDKIIECSSEHSIYSI